MNHFGSINLTQLNRCEIEHIAIVAATELKSLKQIQAKREQFDFFVFAFFAGVCFTALALLCGVSLH